MNRRIAKDDAQMMLDASYFMTAVAHLIDTNLTEEADGDGKPFLNGFYLSGLMSGMKLASHTIADRGDWLREKVEEEEAEEKKAQAALARRQGQDKARGSNIEAECGTQRAA